ncbi:hypothetical protein AcW2_004890 [Taiwanofungus camphoratus]|nr:hypothetical protein AcW2_004890 [Antrodia cinnamomea]
MAIRPQQETVDWPPSNMNASCITQDVLSNSNDVDYIIQPIRECPPPPPPTRCLSPELSIP